MKLTAVVKTLCKDKQHYVFISQKENSSTLFPRKETNERKKKGKQILMWRIKKRRLKIPSQSSKKSLYQNLTFWTPTRNQTREPIAVGPWLGPRSLSDSFFFFFFPLIASIKSSTGTKGISTISDRNRKACFFCTF